MFWGFIRFIALKKYIFFVDPAHDRTAEEQKDYTYKIRPVIQDSI